MGLVERDKKTCEACLKALSLQSFYPHKKGGYSPLCKTCTVADNKLRRHSPDEHRRVLEARRVVRSQAKASLESAIQTKECCKCSTEKSLEDFRPHRGLYGRSSWCRECERHEGAQYRLGNREEINARKREAWVSTERTQEQRSEAAARSRVWYTTHRTHAREAQKAYYVLHKPEIVAKATAWIKEHPERYREFAKNWRIEHGTYRNRLVGDLTADQWLETLTYFNHACAYCLRTDIEITMDHLVPRSKGGLHTAANVIPACRSCNSRKHSNSIFVMLPRRAA